MSTRGLQYFARLLEVPANNITCPICTWLVADVRSLVLHLMTASDVYLRCKVPAVVTCAGQTVFNCLRNVRPVLSIPDRFLASVICRAGLFGVANSIFDSNDRYIGSIYSIRVWWIFEELSLFGNNYDEMTTTTMTTKKC